MNRVGIRLGRVILVAMIGCECNRVRTTSSDVVQPKATSPVTNANDVVHSRATSAAAKTVILQSPPRAPECAERALGTFEVSGTALLIGDPAYGLQGMTPLKGARVGRWKAFACLGVFGRAGRRSFALRAQHEDDTTAPQIGWKVGEHSFLVVDSGQAGVFDARHVDDEAVIGKGVPIADYCVDDNRRWYAANCAATESLAGLIPFGAVSSSGLGDGVYRFFAHYDDQQRVTGVEIVFLGDEEG